MTEATVEQLVPPAPATREVVLGAIDRLDAILSSDDLFSRTPEDVALLRLEQIAAAVAHHAEHNERFAALCDRHAFAADRIDGAGALDLVPLLPTSLFKRRPPVVTTAGDGPLTWTTSSGTQGTVSAVPRDDTTMVRFFASIAAGIDGVLGVQQSDLRIFDLGPPFSEADHLWISYVMAGVAVATESEHYGDEHGVDLSRLITDLGAANGDQRIGIIGPPNLLLALAEAVRDRRLQLAPDSLVVAIGGWKGEEGRKVDRERFDHVLAAALGIGVGSVRDAFNMVELNTVVFECEAKSKHCPPWLHLRARDPKDLQVVADDASGILAFLDPTPTSYPAFVLTDDFGRVRRDVPCSCGRTGDIVTIERRVSRIESRGCALKLEMRGAS